MGLNTILFAVLMVGVAGLIIFEAVKSISEEFDFEIPSIGFPKLALPKFSSPKVNVSAQKASFRHNFWKAVAWSGTIDIVIRPNR